MLGFLAAVPIGTLAGCADRRVFAELDARVDPDGSLPGSDGAIGDAGICEPTSQDALGPFYEGGSPMRMILASADEPGDRLLVEGSLVDIFDCRRPLAGYIVDIWQADATGNYYAAASSDYRLRGRIATGADGRFALETIKPGYYETTTGPRPAHLHVRVYDPSGLDRLVTQLYFEGDPFLGPNDGCQPPTCFSGDPLRVMRLSPARIGDRDGYRTAIRLVVPS